MTWALISLPPPWTCRRFKAEIESVGKITFPRWLIVSNLLTLCQTCIANRSINNSSRAQTSDKWKEAKTEKSLKGENIIETAL